MLVPQSNITRVVVEVFDPAKLRGQRCPVPTCRAAVADHKWYDVSKRGAVTCSQTEGA